MFKKNTLFFREIEIFTGKYDMLSKIQVNGDRDETRHNEILAGKAGWRWEHGGLILVALTLGSI